MSKNYHFTTDAHPNIYNRLSPRKFDIYFSEPDTGINSETGLLLLIPGFGANAQSNVYKKMRSVFADKYNVITIQCDYFGWEFMQQEPMQESLDNFCDMGVMQALDNLASIFMVVGILRENNLVFNTKKIIAYGHSHGAYIAYLCNAFAPNLFSLIIDNSAWLFPVYLKTNRLLNVDGDLREFRYLARSVVKDFEILDLPTLYMNFTNQCLIHSFHGVDDNLISLSAKRSFCEQVNRCNLHEITKEKVDKQLFRSTSHGLHADFLRLFDLVYSNVVFEYDSKLEIPNCRIRTKEYSYFFDYSGYLPRLERSPLIRNGS